MITGFDAVDDLVSRHPQAHRVFAVDSAERLRLLLSMPGWLVMSDTGCWVALENTGVSHALHWFCPGGVNIAAIRLMLGHAFQSGVESVHGTTIRGHPYAREAAVLARALGAVRDGGKLVLTAERFKVYNAGKARQE